MKANPGGNIDPKFVVGRDGLIRSIWEALEQQSIRLHAERRIGKTSVIRKMHAEPITGWSPVYQDLERIHSPEEFAQEVYKTKSIFSVVREGDSIFAHKTPPYDGTDELN